MKLEVFKRDRKYIIRVISFDEDKPKEQVKTITDESFARAMQKLQDIIYKELSQSNDNTFTDV